jgi:dolichol-phosphate mannosyltransferase
MPAAPRALPQQLQDAIATAEGGRQHQIEGHIAYPRAVISVVIPVRDEAASVETLFAELQAVLDETRRAWEVVFVDDGSTDGTFSALTRLHDASPSVRVVRLRRNFGKAAALDAGFREASGEVIVTMDGDGQDDPAEIPRLLAKLDEGFDLVSGWKTRRRDPLRRRVVSRLFNAVTGRVSGLRLHDMNCGLKAFRSDVTRAVRLYGELHRYIPVLAHYQGFRVVELAVNHRPRAHGRSRYGLERYLRGFLDLLTVTFMGRYRYRPLHLFGGLGLGLTLLGGAVLVYLLVVKITGEAIGHRPLLTLGVLLVVVGMQFLSLGLLSELLTSQHEERQLGGDRASRLVDEILR